MDKASEEERGGATRREALRVAAEEVAERAREVK
jgi:hypothetical protein